jgi:phosphoglycerate dehydrogenase-like enzyme
MKRALFLLPAENRDAIYGPGTTAEIERLVESTDACDRVGDLDALRPVLAEANIILSGWGMMTLDEPFLGAAPNLEAVFYGAGTVRGFLTEAFWRRNILLTSCYGANAAPVIEYTLAAIVLGLKGMLSAASLTREKRTFAEPPDIKGVYGAKVGIIGVGMVGRGVVERLKDYDVEVYCYDPFVSDDRLIELGASPLPLDDIFRTCDVVSLHAASLPSTAGLITGDHLRSMKKGGVFINTARGAIVRENEMIEVLREGNIWAFIDVTEPEPPAGDSALYDLPNVFLTPHLSGPAGDEIRRQGAYVLEDLRRFLRGDPPRHPVTQDMMEWMA